MYTRFIPSELVLNAGADKSRVAYAEFFFLAVTFVNYAPLGNLKTFKKTVCVPKLVVRFRQLNGKWKGQRFKQRLYVR